VVATACGLDESSPKMIDMMIRKEYGWPGMEACQDAGLL
jgi:hypothetical protein